MARRSSGSWSSAAGRRASFCASGERIAADKVICNADPAALGDGLFGEAARRAVSPWRRRRPLAQRDGLDSPRAKTAGFPLARHNVFFSDDYPAEFAALAAGRLADRAECLSLRAGPRR